MRSVVLAGGGTNAHPARTGESAPRREIRFYSQRSDVLIETIGVHHLCPSPHEVFHEFLLCVVAPIHLRRDRAIQGPFLARRARGRTDTAEVAEGRRGVGAMERASWDQLCSHDSGACRSRRERPDVSHGTDERSRKQGWRDHQQRPTGSLAQASRRENRQRAEIGAYGQPARTFDMESEAVSRRVS